MSNILTKLKKEELQYFIVKTLEKDNIIFNEGDFCDCVGIVESGEIEIVSYSYSGKEIVFTRLTPGMIFGNNLAFSSDPCFKGNVIAAKKSKVYNAFLPICQDKNYLLFRLFFKSGLQLSFCVVLYRMY